jgi:hypothetical protein
MRFNKMFVSIVLAVLAMIPVSLAAQCTGAGADSCVAATTQSVTLTTTVAESLTVSLSTASLTIPAGGWPATSPFVTATVNYNLAASQHQNAAGGMYAALWFSSPSAAITGTNGVVAIPSASVDSNVTWSGTSYTNAAMGPCNVTLPSVLATAVGAVAGAACGYPNPRLTPAQITAAPSGTLTDAYDFQYANPLPNTPSVYSGTLFLTYAAI